FNCFRTVRRVCELQSEHLSVLFCLLKPVGRRLVFRFCFHHGKWEIAPITKEIIHSFRRSTDKAFSDWHYPAIRDRPLLSYRIRLVVPARSLELRHDELATCIRFCWHEARKVAETHLCEERKEAPAFGATNS